MKILYVSDTWTALKEVLYEGMDEFKGMPGFWRPLKRLIEQGNEIDMVLYSFDTQSQGEKKCSIEWLNKVNIVGSIDLKGATGWKKPIVSVSQYKLLEKYVSAVIDSEKYDFVYGHGPYAEAALKMCRKKSIPFGMRRYGDTLLSLMEQKGKGYAMLSRPIDYFSYTTSKEFLLATNDGTKVNKLVNTINKSKPPYDFYFWVNGVDEISFDENVQLPFSDNFLLYTARVTDWKRQDLAIELLHLLHKRGERIHLVVCGQIDSQDFYMKLIKKVTEYELDKYVHFMGGRRANELNVYAQNAIACLSFYDVSNFGNCIIEYLRAGGLVICKNDSSLDEVIENGKDGFMVDSMEEASDVVQRLIGNPLEREQVKKKAKEKAEKVFMTWDERVDKEIQLIAKACGEK